MANDSAAAALAIGDVVSLEIPTGHLGAGHDTVGMISDMQTPDAALVNIRVAHLIPMSNQIPVSGQARVDPQLDYVWLACNLVTKRASFAVD